MVPLQSKVPPYTCAVYRATPIQGPSLNLCVLWCPSNTKYLPTPVRIMVPLQSKVPPYTCAYYGAPPIQSPSLHLCVLWCPSNPRSLPKPVRVMVPLQSKVPPYTCACYGAQSKVSPYSCAFYGASPIQGPSLNLCVLWCPSNPKSLPSPVRIMVPLQSKVPP